MFPSTLAKVSDGFSMYKGKLKPEITGDWALAPWTALLDFDSDLPMSAGSGWVVLPQESVKYIYATNLRRFTESARADDRANGIRRVVTVGFRQFLADEEGTTVTVYHGTGCAPAFSNNQMERCVCSGRVQSMSMFIIDWGGPVWSSFPDNYKLVPVGLYSRTPLLDSRWRDQHDFIDVETHEVLDCHILWNVAGCYSPNVVANHVVWVEGAWFIPPRNGHCLEELPRDFFRRVALRMRFLRRALPMVHMVDLYPYVSSWVSWYLRISLWQALSLEEYFFMGGHRP
jgi:hypothetical protein